MHSAAATPISLLGPTPRPSQRSSALRIAGLAIASLVPAAFWCAVLGLLAKYFGFGLSTMTLGVIGGGIAVFLFAVCAPLMLRMPSATSNAEDDDRLND